MSELAERFDMSQPAVSNHLEVWDTNFRRLDALLDNLRAPGNGGSLATPIGEQEKTMPKITPFLWFDVPLDEPAAYYRSIFKNVRVLSQSATSATFEIEGQRFMALNGGPHHRFNDAVFVLHRL